MNRMLSARWIALAVRIYCALLVVYPAEYRREYGPLMAQLFRDVSRERLQRHGLLGAGLWWCRTLSDLAVTAIEQRRKVKTVISRYRFTQMSGTLLALAGALVALGAFSQLQPDDHYTYYGIYQALLWLVGPGLLLLGLGSIALALRYDRALGNLGQWAAILSGVGALVMGAGMFATALEDRWWNIGFVGGMVHTLALMLFGLLHLRRPALPVFRALPLQIAAGWLLLMLGVLRTDSQMINNALAFLIFVGMGLAWLAIGLAVNRQQRDTTLATA